jgi:hypothetical protein
MSGVEAWGRLRPAWKLGASVVRRSVHLNTEVREVHADKPESGVAEDIAPVNHEYRSSCAQLPVRRLIGYSDHPGDPGGQMQIQAGLHVLEVATGDLADAAKPVPQGAAVNVEHVGGLVVIAAAI